MTLRDDLGRRAASRLGGGFAVGGPPAKSALSLLLACKRMQPYRDIHLKRTTQRRHGDDASVDCACDYKTQGANQLCVSGSPSVALEGVPVAGR